MNDIERLRWHLAVETEGDRTPAQVDKQFSDEEIEDIERLTAADKVLKMRRVRELAPNWPETTRAAYAKAFEALSLQFAAAAAYLKRHRADDEFIPEFLRERGVM